jgi:hypothetical protein
MQDFETLRQPLLRDLAMSRREERESEEKKMPFIVATYVYACSPRAAHALCSDQFKLPKSNSLISSPLLRMRDFTASLVWLRAGG